MIGSAPAERRVYALAAQHGIVAERLPLDNWADEVTELSGDPIEDLVETLRRCGLIDGREMIAFPCRLFGRVAGTWCFRLTMLR